MRPPRVVTTLTGSRKHPRGGWVGANRSRRASDCRILYGHGLLQRESSRWPSYIIVTTPAAYRVAKPQLVQEPEGFAYAQWLDWAHLQEITESLPNNVELVIGLGGGRALDASKYVALSRGLPLILVPTVISSGAIIHGHLCRWEGRKIKGRKESWPWIDFEEILVDYDVVLEASYFLNTAGLGDVLCGIAGIAEWRYRARTGVGPPFDESEVAPTVQHHQEIAQVFPKTVTPEGQLSTESIRFIMTTVQERDARALRHPARHPQAITPSGWPWSK